MNAQSGMSILNAGRIQSEFCGQSSPSVLITSANLVRRKSMGLSFVLGLSSKTPCPRPPMYVLPDFFGSVLEPERSISTISDRHDGIVLEEDIHKPKPVPCLPLVMPRIKPLCVDGEPLSKDMTPCAVKRPLSVLHRANYNPTLHIPRHSFGDRRSNHHRKCRAPAKAGANGLDQGQMID
jgi:hypothetical protein